MIASVLLFLATVLIALWLYVHRKYSYFRDRGILHDTPNFPLGNLGSLSSVDDCVTLGSNHYLKFRGQDVLCGMYLGLKPVLLITDLDVIRDILVRDFNNFTDHHKIVHVDTSSDPLGPSLYSLQGELWRHMRTKLSPAYTSTRSLEAMFEVTQECARNLCEFVSRGVLGTEGPVNAQDISVRYLCDALGSYGFGIDFRGTTDEDPVLLKIAHRIFNPTGKMLYFWAFIYPIVSNWVKWDWLTKDTREFLKIIDRIVKYREQNNVRRNDILQVWLDVHQRGSVVDDESGETLGKSQAHGVHAESFMMFAFIYSTGKAVLSLALYELAKNQQIQGRARQEISRIVSENGSFDIGAVEKMTYLQQIVDGMLSGY